MRKGAEFLCGFVDHETGLPLASVDLWEQQEGQHAYTAAATIGGCGRPPRWPPGTSPRARRSMPPQRPTDRRRDRADCSGATSTDASSRAQRRPLGRDRDRSRRGLRAEDSVPEPQHPIRRSDRSPARLLPGRARLAVRGARPASPQASCHGRRRGDGSRGALRRDLPAGGRHVRGREPVADLDTLARARPAAARRRAGHRRTLEWALSRRTGLDLLPEQVLPDGSPAWVLPLAWSHAMLLLAARPELAIVRRLDASRLTGSGPPVRSSGAAARAAAALRLPRLDRALPLLRPRPRQSLARRRRCTASSAGREVRIEAAPGGVSVEPLDDAIAAEVGWLLGAPARPRRRSGPGRAAEPVLAALARAARRVPAAARAGSVGDARLA